MKKTMDQRVKEIRVKKMSRFVSGLMGFLVGFLYKRPCKVTIDYHCNIRDYRDKPLIVVSNHASRFDYAFMRMAMKRPLNIIAAENEFHRKKFKTVFKLGQVIPKRNFYADLTTVKNVARLLKNYKNACIPLFPCGMSCVSGAQQPSALGTGKLLKHFGVNVLAVRIHGAYLVCPKFDVKDRYGKVEVELDELFTPEQIEALSAEEIERKVDEAIFTDDYAWNATRQNGYNRKDGKFAENMEQILYKCPKCGAEMQMEGRGTTIKCKACGNGATLDDRYNLAPLGDSVVPVNPREWFDWDRQMRRAVVKPDFVMEERVTLGTMPVYDYIGDNKLAYDVGEGTLRLDVNGLTYDGTRDGKPCKTFIPRDNLNTLCLPVDGSFFYTYASGEFLLFTPETPSSVRWMMAVEEIYRANGGKWQNYPWFDYDKQGFKTKQSEQNKDEENNKSDN